MAKPPPPPRPIKRATNVKDSTVRGRALKPAKGAGMRPELFDEPLPPFVEPCLATLRANVPAGDKWVHEIKWDGYRLQIRIDNGKVTHPHTPRPRLDRPLPGDPGRCQGAAREAGLDRR